MGQEYHVVRNKRYEVIPPDGGWGYMICVAAIINYNRKWHPEDGWWHLMIYVIAVVNLCMFSIRLLLIYYFRDSICATSMFIGSFGMIYKDFIAEQHMTSTTVSLVNAMNAILGATAGYMTSPLLKLLSMRKVTLIASFLFNVGIFCTFFINTTALFFVCQGIQSLGLGIIYTTSCTIINDYFLKKRLLAISLTQTCSAIGGMVAPYLVKLCLDSFGYRGTLLMVSAISLQTFIAVALMQPVAWHMIRVEIEGVCDELKLLIGEKPAIQLPVTTPTITLTDTDLPFEEKNIQKQKKGSKSIMNEILDVGLLKKFLLSNASMGPSYCVFSEFLFSLMLPQALYDMDFTKEEVARAVSLISFGDLVTRVFFVLTSKWLTKLGNQEVYVASVVLAFISRIMMLWSENTTVIMVFITIMGIARCSIMVMPPLILADSFGSEQFTKTLGLFMMMLGVMNLVLGPAVGAIRDMSKSYSTAFYVITSCYPVVALLWTIELIYKKNKHRRTAQRLAVEKLKNTTNKVK